MSKQCKQPHCFAPDVPCHLGEEDRNQCEIWKESVGHPTADQPEVPSEPEGLLFPWSGNSLGTVDVPFVAGRSNPTVIGVVGPQNAGKTTLLAAWYLLLGKGLHIRDYRFASSYTLNGWENIAHSFRWEGHAGPSFPVHTSSRAGRSPGLMHLAFRRRNALATDFLFADAPGEWFKRWAIDRDGEDAVGARWLGDHASAYLLIADCDALAGASGGNARSILQLLIQRLGAERKERPVALVWSKSDLTVPTQIREAVQGLAHRVFPDIKEFSVSVYPSEQEAGSSGQGFMKLLEWAISSPQPRFVVPKLEMASDDPFLMYGRL